MKNNFPRVVNSNFSAGLGKKAFAKKNVTVQRSESEDGMRRSNRKRKQNEPMSPEENTVTPDGASSLPSVRFDRSFATGTSATPHRPIPPSFRAPQYKRLLPSNIVRLSHENEIIVVVPDASTFNPTAPGYSDVKYISDCIDSVLVAASMSLPTQQRQEELSRIKMAHERIRDGKVVHEYACRVKNYPERFKLSTPHMTSNDV